MDRLKSVSLDGNFESFIGNFDEVVKNYSHIPGTVNNSEYVKKLNEINHISFFAYELYRFCLKDLKNSAELELCQRLKSVHRKNIISIKSLIELNRGNIQTHHGFNSYELSILAIKAFEFIPKGKKNKAIKTICCRLEKQIIKKLESSLKLAPRKDYGTLRSLIVIIQSNINELK